MKRRFCISTLGLLAVLLVSACARPSPASNTATPQPPTQAIASATRPSSATAAPLAIATSRGPNLEASDPAHVKLASGKIQLTEFFRFT